MADAVNKVRFDYRAVKHSGLRRKSQIKYFVLHTAEADAPKTGAEGVGRYFESRAARGSTHFGVDNNSTQRYLEDVYVAWGAPPLNISGLHVECMGFAKYSRTKWLKEYAPMFRRVGWLIANRCRKYNIPLEYITIAQLKKKGINPKVGAIVTHNQVSKTWNESDHWDPGPHFPLDVVMEWTKFYAQGWVKAKVARPVLHMHNEGKWVKRLQNELVACGFYTGNVHGKFTVAVEDAVVKFQKAHKIKATGIVNTATWQALDKAS